MSDQLLVRLISSKDHQIGRDELVCIIRETGTDRYDAKRRQMFDDFYGKHEVHFFAESVPKDHLEAEIKDAVEKLPGRTKGDRGYEVHPDIAIIYDASKCKMIDGVYDYKSGSDCYRFEVNPKDALFEVRLIESKG